MEKYDHKEIEKKWQAVWETAGLYRTNEDSSKPKCYVLDMFPYPSGDGLHVGHQKGFIATDIYSRMKTMRGFNVLHPMGFDAFGLPAENYAIKMKVNPMVMTEKNVVRYKEQLSSLGFNYDWEREVNTTDPAFYKWTQWIFLKMFEKGLAYESYEPINWCPSCQTGLANEDLEDGKCERCSTVIEKKPMRQWVLRITDYADRMLADIDKLDWPTSIKESQKNWIGRSEGAEIIFNIKYSILKIPIFTTRPDTLFGATYVVLAPELKLIDELKSEISNWNDVALYREETKARTEIERTAEGREKTGVELKGVSAINPANGEELPVYVADYVLAHYGTGAVMAVPAHDERDFEFAEKYNLPINEVISPRAILTGDDAVREGVETLYRNVVDVILENEDGEFLLIMEEREGKKDFHFVGGGIEDGDSEIDTVHKETVEESGYSDIEILGSKFNPISTVGFRHTKQKNQDTFGYFYHAKLKSNKRVSCEVEDGKHKIGWYKKEDIAGLITWPQHKIAWLNFLNNGKSVNTEEGILINSGNFNGLSSEEAKKLITDFVKGEWVTKYRLKDWVFSRQRYWGEPIPLVHCEKDGVVAVPEKDLPVVLPVVESYAPTGTGESPLADIADWVNTMCPKCGGHAKRETNTMPQWAGSSWYYLRYIDPQNTNTLVDKEKEKYWSPVDVYVGGQEHATRHLIYARFYHKFLYDIGVVNYDEPFQRLQNVGLVMAEDGRKMSKRWGNVVNPDDVVETYGADTLRLYEMFMGPFGQSVSWSTESIVGPRRFLERVWRLQEKVSAVKTSTVDAVLHKTIKKVGDDIEAFGFNTAISSLMILANEMEKAESVSITNYETLLVLLAPFAPHITEELWYSLGNKTSVHLATWPTYDEAMTVVSEVTIAVQVNGKLRDTMVMPSGASQNLIEESALALLPVAKWIEGKKITKIIFVPGKLVNIVFL